MTRTITTDARKCSIDSLLLLSKALPKQCHWWPASVPNQRHSIDPIDFKSTLAKSSSRIHEMQRKKIRLTLGGGNRGAAVTAAVVGLR